MARFQVWIMATEVDVFDGQLFVTFAKNVHGFVTDILKTNVDRNSQLIAEMRQRANDRIEYENERKASR